ncbi:MAG TPA: ribosome maturation factor RimM [Syntrophomonadaceae bacterium]|nr:ribosome maturation factor RimM [Syntrophomonadaceae bacterium]
MDPRELIKVGKIVGTHGYKGSVKVQLLTDFPDRFQPGQKYLVLRAKEALELTLDQCSPHGGMMLMKFRGIDDMEAAEQLRNVFLNVTTDQLYPLPEGSFYHFQLIGMQVEDVDKGPLGQLAEVLETGANDVYVVKSDTYGEILIPAIKQVVMAVDVPNHRLTVKLLDGLLGEQ